jgi:hypothetical protein
MPRIIPRVATHQLKVNLAFSPIRQKKRSFKGEIQRAIITELTKLLIVGFNCEVMYPDWMTNMVMIRKNIGKW